MCISIGGWNNSDNNSYTTGVQLTDGVYDFRIEFFEGGGNAYVQFFYEFLGTDADWQATYYDNAGLRGNPILSQSEPSRRIPLEFSIGASSPLYQPRIGTKWSARWQGDFYFWRGDYIVLQKSSVPSLLLEMWYRTFLDKYTFRAQAAGCVRVYIDGSLLLDGWTDSQKDINNVFRQIGEREHTTRVEYYHQTGESSLRLWWYLVQNSQQPF